MPMTTADKMMQHVLPEALRLADPAPREYKAERYELAFETEGLAPCVNAAHKAVQWWLNDILHRCRDRRRWVTLYGRSGCGKTHLATAAASVIRSHGRRVQRWNWSRLRSLMLDGSPGLWDQVADAPILVLDDVGAEYTASDKTAALSASLLYDLLEARLGRWMLITSNLAPADWVDVRVTSRLFRGQNEVVDMSGAEDFCFRRWKGGAR